MQPSRALNNFTIAVEGVGAFTFCRRTTRLQMSIQAEYSRLTEGVLTPTPTLIEAAGRMALLKVLTVSTPEGWPDLYEADAADEDLQDKINKVVAALLKRERELRGRKNSQTSQAPQ